MLQEIDAHDGVGCSGAGGPADRPEQVHDTDDADAKTERFTFMVSARGKCKQGPQGFAQRSLPAAPTMLATVAPAGLSEKRLLKTANEWAADQAKNGGHHPFRVTAPQCGRSRHGDGSITMALRCGSCSDGAVDFAAVKALRRHFASLEPMDAVVAAVKAHGLSTGISRPLRSTSGRCTTIRRSSTLASGSASRY